VRAVPLIFSRSFLSVEFMIRRSATTSPVGRTGSNDVTAHFEGIEHCDSNSPRRFRAKTDPSTGPVPAYCAMKPPSMTNSVPVMNEASSEARNNTP
jgi:hypothetical protein